MKLFNCLLKDGSIKKMTLKKVIEKKKKGQPVKIIDVAEIRDKGNKK